MKEAPEGLDYGTVNKLHKFDETPVNDDYMEDGKIQCGSTPSAEHEKAETLRMLGQGSHDPMYKDKHKNK
jgi:hypothetical protein